MLAAERKEQIKEQLKTKRSVNVSELAQSLQVTTETIRRDLAMLEKEGFLIKTHGGAIIRSQVMTSLSHEVLSTLYLTEKRRLAFEAAQLVSPGDCIFLDCSTTVFQMCPYIKDMSLTVISNSLDVINYFAGSSTVSVICPGGQFHAVNKSFMGVETSTFLNRHHFDKAFISCRSVSLDSGLCDSTELMADIRRTVIENSSFTALLMDHTKVDRHSYAPICPLTDINAMIVDEELSDEWRDVLDAACIRTICCMD